MAETKCRDCNLTCPYAIGPGSPCPNCRGIYQQLDEPERPDLLAEALKVCRRIGDLPVAVNTANKHTLRSIRRNARRVLAMRDGTAGDKAT